MALSVEDLKIKIFADGADLNGMLEMYSKPYIKGLTTNPTLMKKAGISDYKEFAKEVLSEIKEKSISFEVFSDNFDEMCSQALEIASWGENVYVKIPVTNTEGESSSQVIEYLTLQNVKINVTALMTIEQVRSVAKVLNPDVPSYVSVFAGRIADTGRSPVPIMEAALEILQDVGKAELIWASPRELLNIIEADAIGCDIITATTDILNKLPLLDMNLDQYSLETVKMFRMDSVKAGYQL
jgi:transaldolase